MGPIILFDKSFLQALTVDESVWFGHFFSPVVSPIFFIETLADLDKQVREGRTPEDEVRIIASKFPDASSYPCSFHPALAVNNLLGGPVPMDGRIPLPGGRPVAKGDERGFIFEETPEMIAFARWQREEFLGIERSIARVWRASLKAVDIGALTPIIRKLGIDGRSCRSLEDVTKLARGAVGLTSKNFPVADLLELFLSLGREESYRFRERWSVSGYRAMTEYAPYAAHVLTVELFFQFALAAGLIGTGRSSNRVDIGYLNYLPFCMAFVSSDRLHQRIAPHFLRANQRFVWGPDLKRDLARINTHFLGVSESDRERGISSFAHAPPRAEGSLVCELRDAFMGRGYDDKAPVVPPAKGTPKSEELLAGIEDWEDAPAAAAAMVEDGSDADMMMIKRRMVKRRGSWWQLPKDLEVPKE